MRDLESIRREVAECDQEILRQLERRMNCVNEIIDYKKATGVPILQPMQKAEKLPKRKMLQKSNKRIPSLTMGIQAL